MEPDVIRIYSSSPPPMEDEDEDDEFSDFTGVPNSVSLTEFETPITFDQSQALNATSPPELLSNGRVVGLSHTIKSNGVKHGSGQIDTQDGRTVSVEELKMLSEHHPHVNSAEIASGSRTNRDECNGSVEGLTNGLGGSPSPLHKNGKLEPCRDQQSDEHTDVYNFADFSSFSNTDHNQLLNSNWEQNVEECSPSQDDTGKRCPAVNRCTDANRDSVISATDFPSDALSNGDCRFHAGSDLNRDLDNDCVVLDSPEPVSTAKCQAINGEVVQSGAEDEDDRLDGAQSDDKVSENETETETETSLGRLLSTDALEEFGDFSLTGSVPSPQLQEDMVSPGDQSQLAEDDNDEDFGDFGDAASFAAAGFADFDQQEETKNEGLSDFAEGPSNTEIVSDEATTSAFPGSDSFADFQVVDNKEQWEAFSEPAQIQSEGESWASFGQETDQRDVQEERKTSLGQDVCKTALLISRLEKIFQVCFELVLARQVEEQVLALKSFIQPLEPSERKDGDRETTCRASDVQDVWQKLHDVNNSVGLRYQWGGSHTNKALLGSLGIDTRNILFTGQRKQPVIVPMYAASLGMLEPTKEPVKLVSAAEIIASIALSPSVSTELKDCPADHTQESLPPVQFDWSSSGLTNPLDASGGSSCLNLDFFGPVDESPSGSATSMPGVDPELYELTQAKMEGSGGGSRVVVDAFARLMSTVEKTSTSTRRPAQREENLSEEAEQVIAALPDLSFMQAKVLMFPSTLTPLQPRD